MRIVYVDVDVEVNVNVMLRCLNVIASYVCYYHVTSIGRYVCMYVCMYVGGY